MSGILLEETSMQQEVFAQTYSSVDLQNGNLQSQEADCHQSLLCLNATSMMPLPGGDLEHSIQRVKGILLIKIVSPV